jgi:hypothetical protein
MRDLVRLIIWMVADLFRSRTALEVEIWMLRQQINVLRRTAPKKQTFSAIDRLIFVCLYRLLPGVRDALALVKPETGLCHSVVNPYLKHRESPVVAADLPHLEKRPRMV